MDTTALDELTNKLAKTDDTEFDPAEKLVYYNIGYGILYGLIIAEQEDSYEEEYTKDTVADQRDYKQKTRIHHINWLKIDYGSGFIPARYRSEQSLISAFGPNLETVLTNWSQSNPIYWYSGHHFFVIPAPSASQAGASRLKASIEVLPDDIIANGTPDLPENTHQGLAAYAAMSRLDEDDPLWKKADRIWAETISILQNTSFPRARQAEMQAAVPDDDGSNY